MGWRFRKSVKIAPGVRVNIGKKSTSISVGGKGYRKTFSSTGKVTTSVGIPGSGLSYTTTENTNKKKSGTNNQNSNAFRTPKKPSAKSYKTCGIILQILSPVMFVLSLMLALVMPVIGVVFSLFAIFLFIMGRKYKKEAKSMENIGVVTEDTE